MDHVFLGYSLVFLSGGVILAWWACGRRARRTAQAQPREAQRAREQETASGDLSEAAREISQLELHVRERTSELATTNARLLAEIEVRLEAEERLKESHRLLESNEAALKKAHDELERRVRERTAELAETNRSLTALLKQQEVNIDMAKQVLALIDPTPPRHTPLPGSLDLFVTYFYFPCHAAGGDHFFVRTLGAGEGRRTILSLKDQSGHEVGCVLRSILTDLIHSSLLYTEETPSLENVLSRLNDEICASDVFGEGDFFTSINAEIDHATLRLSYLSTGHPPFLVIRGDTVLSLPEEDGPGANLPAGLVGNRRLSAGAYPLKPGDRLIFYTDGLLDVARHPGQETLTSAQLCERVASLLRSAPGAGVAQIAGQLLRSLGHLDKAGAITAHPDDIAVLALEIEPAAKIYQDTIHPRDADELNRQTKQLFSQIKQEWVDHGIEKPEERLRLVLEEGLRNAWHHGNRDAPDKAIVVRRGYGNDAQLQITDEGAGFDSETVYDPTSFENLTKPSGRGLFILRMLADEVRWNQPGNAVTLYFARHSWHPTRKKGSDARKNPWDLWRSGARYSHERSR